MIALSLACSVTSFALMIYTMVSTRRRARIHRERMRAFAESGVAHRDQVNAAYRDRHFITMRSAQMSIAFAVAALVLLVLP
ncbi:hypothetical protein M2271_002153 [Streptomyces sp. LBL]|uniref:hypothetical protein n=1 Tax=Streptomyces sp. LBL TaxID=2940562 RepID=UPI00247417B4|nr:hypothetical protein [Streptomyces sp. LBL]MDH6624351.1 hypothetical protein [Streptomyces sp. LBL]